MDLEALLREAVRDENRRRKEKPLPKSDYTDDQWIRHRTVGLVHLSREGQETSLGVFAEFLHRTRPNTRRLVRSSGTPDAIELVRGPGWADTVPAEKLPDTLDETDAIRRYLARRSAAEIKAELIKLSADAMLDELLDD